MFACLFVCFREASYFCLCVRFSLLLVFVCLKKKEFVCDFNMILFYFYFLFCMKNSVSFVFVFLLQYFAVDSFVCLCLAILV